MSVVDLIAEAHRQHVALYLDGDTLRFRASGTGLSPELKQRLAGQKAEIIAFLKERTPTLPIRAPDLDEVPAKLTHAQQRMYFLHQSEDHGNQYNMAFSFDLVGALDAQMLETSVRAIIQRHVVLRSTYENGAGTLTQIPQPASRFQLSRFVAQTPSKLTELVRQHADQVFDLGVDLPLRIALIETDLNHAVLSLVFHHIAFDGWSYQLFLSALSAELSGTVVPKADYQMADIARWQNDILPSEPHRNYWQTRLANALPLNGLTPDRPRQPNQSYSAQSFTTQLDANLTSKLNDFAGAIDATPFALLQSSFGALIARLTGRNHAIVGTPVSGREHPAFENIIGLFVNTLPIKTDVPGAQSFRDFAKASSDAIKVDLSHQDLPLDVIISDTVASRDPSYPPLLQILFAMNDDASDHLTIPCVVATPQIVPRHSVNFEIEVHVTPVTDGYTLEWYFAENLFDVSTVTALAQSFRAFLTNAMARPDSLLERLNITDDAMDALVDDWNARSDDIAPFCDFTERFGRHVASNPTAIACFDDYTQWSYAALEQRSDTVAAALQAVGVKPGDFVGLSVERDLNMILGIVAILKTGAAYVPLDGALPPTRLDHVLEDCDPGWILGDHQSPKALQSRPFIDIETVPTNSAIFAPVVCEPEKPAYVIFTSGTTGQPKGVVVTRGNLSNFLSGIAEQTPLASDATVPLVTSISFDVHVVEVQHALASGAKIAVPGGDRLTNPREMATFLNRANVTDMHATPATWQMMIDAGWHPSRPMQLYSGGDALTDTLKNALLQVGPDISLWNYYGPTEATVYVSATAMHECEPVDIGRAMSGNAFHVLDANRMPLPPGFIGQLFLSGENLAQGYLKKPNLTANKFLRCPISGQRIYDTGDVARWTSHGHVDVLGRTDFQMKIRGHRVELNEIEHLLSREPEITEAVAIPSSDSMTILAFVRPVLPAERLQGIRQTLESQLPGYMVPSQIVGVDQLPLTPNNKIDRTALTQFVQPQAKQFTPPSTDDEQRVAAIWRSLLGIDQIDIFSSFFELGGHSLLAIRLLSKLEADLGVTISLRNMLMAPTVSGIAHLISNTRPASNDDAPEILL